MDPVFGGVSSLRAAVDRFLSLQAEMDRAREEFGSAVHRTLALVSVTGGKRPAQTGCPDGVNASYRRALDAGGLFLALGRRLEGAYREIRRGDEFGDVLGLTPDYRLKVKRSKELHSTLLRDFREMRVAFHDQLGAELRYAGCKLDDGKSGVTAKSGGGAYPDPSNPGDWDLERTDTAGEPTLDAASPASAPAATNGAAGDGEESAPAIWITIDNTRCQERSRLTLDSVAVGEIPAGKKIPVRTRTGPHTLCVLPASDRRSCGAAGTVRRAYLHEGWSLQVRCAK